MIELQHGSWKQAFKAGQVTVLILGGAPNDVTG